MGISDEKRREEKRRGEGYLHAFSILSLFLKKTKNKNEPKKKGKNYKTKRPSGYQPSGAELITDGEGGSLQVVSR